MARGDLIQRRDPDVCHDCRVPFSADAGIYVRRWKCISSVLGPDGDGIWLAIHTVERVPLCGACFGEEPKGWLRWEWLPCLGCARLMFARRGISVCSARCEQRARRRRRRQARAAYCVVCGLGFAGRRCDASYCSARCKMRAARQRAHGARREQQPAEGPRDPEAVW
jgi:hypothetical protein